jgi:hypothetical protein
MALDWSKIGTGSQEPLLRPRDIFADLPNKPWPYLRLEQGEVLEKWFKRRPIGNHRNQDLRNARVWATSAA